MPICKKIRGCDFLKSRMSKMPQVAEVFQNNLCKKNHSECARYKVYECLGNSKVPPDLYPNDVRRANLILSRS